jgi:hypothetical protein
MNRLLFVVLSVALLGLGVAAFADNQGSAMPSAYNGSEDVSAFMATPTQSPMSANQLIGEKSDQVIKDFGKPEYKSVTDNGTTVYDYVKIHGPYGSRDYASVSQLKVFIARDGTVVNTDLSFT